MKCLLAIPTFNGGEVWKDVADKIRRYSQVDLYVHVIDSGSKDNTLDVASDYGFKVTEIESKDFNHGSTRNLAVNHNSKDFDVIIFLTQDAIPEPNFIDTIISAFDDEDVVCAYGRQLPHIDATPIAEHARYFNYPEKSHTCSFSDIPIMGIKTAFMSNSFSAYRVSVFEKLSGFPTNTILGEDMHFAARAILSGYKIAYVSDATVRHSHNYSLFQEFKRYFDIGVFHADEPWIRDKFGGAGGEGKRFIFSELSFILRKKRYVDIPLAIMNNGMKLIGYKLGQKYKFLPKSFVKYCSMHRGYWC
ncbi:glycosyltransferase family 2 protein [Pectobacterium peruviense]|uniref:Rhamnosyltransferase n=1 Tax=Pectobacterium peruviense TaxID=2066479 RepID=A0ABX4S7Q9_9GAMM|nr:glycosyltransferase [Pectobacterium peruviense]KML68255.1 rhamnosyltransferase [Pectobacterium peruviense]PKX81227.1 rhamnosyltransferase [Pectobacterium peruviense]PKX86577.1 rhamnosyltransferase [Pectobacterium peruviense]